MKTSAPSIEKTGLKTGFVTFLALVAYFMLMKLLGLSNILELRFFNFVILAFGICYGIKKYKHQLHELDFYLKGWGEGIFIAAVSVILFALFMSLYLVYFDQPLLEYISETTTIGVSLGSGLNIFFAILMEGMAASVVITLAAMQYFKSIGKVKNDTALTE